MNCQGQKPLVSLKASSYSSKSFMEEEEEEEEEKAARKALEIKRFRKKKLPGRKIK